MRRWIWRIIRLSLIISIGIYGADFNRDGKEDVIVFNPQSGVIKLWKMKNNYRIDSVKKLDTLKKDVRIYPRIKDLDGDKQSDLLLQNRQNSEIWILKMKNFSKVRIIKVGKPGNAWKIFAVEDVDGDGYDDIFIKNLSTNEIAYYLGAQIFGTELESEGIVRHSLRRPEVMDGGSDSTDSEWEAVSMGDMNGDGIADILLRSNKSAGLIIWKLTKDFKVAKEVDLFAPGSLSWRVAAIFDLDGNGKADPVLYDEESGKIRILKMLKNFKKSVVSIKNTRKWPVQWVGDFDSNGRGDILCASVGGEGFRIYHFNAKMRKRVYFIDRDVGVDRRVSAVEDLNGDGMKDLLLRNRKNGKVDVLKISKQWKGTLSKLGNPGSSAWREVAERVRILPTYVLLEGAEGMKEKRMDHWILPLSNGDYTVFGGHKTGFVPLKNSEKWDAIESSFLTRRMNYPHDRFAMAYLGDQKWLLSGGALEGGKGPGKSGAEIYSEEKGSFRKTASMKYKRTGHVMVRLQNGDVLVVGATKNAPAAKNSEIYLPKQSRFIKGGTLLTPRSVPWALSTSDGEAVVFWGKDSKGKVIQSVELYHPATRRFSRLKKRILNTVGWHPFTETLRHASETYRMPDGNYLLGAERDNKKKTVLFRFEPGSKKFIPLNIAPALPSQDASGFVLKDLFVDSDCMCAYLIFVRTPAKARQIIRLYTLDLNTFTLLKASADIRLPQNYYLNGSARVYLRDRGIILTGGTTKKGALADKNPSEKTMLLKLKEWLPVKADDRIIVTAREINQTITSRLQKLHYDIESHYPITSYGIEINGIDRSDLASLKGSVLTLTPTPTSKLPTDYLITTVSLVNSAGRSVMRSFEYDLDINSSLAVYFTAEPQVGYAPLDVRMTPEVDAKESIQLYHWYFGDGEKSDSNTSRENLIGTPINHTYENVGTYDAKLVVYDSNYRKTSYTLPIQVLNAPPVVTGVTASPSNGHVPLDVDFYATARDHEGIKEFRMDYDGDGKVDEIIRESKPYPTYANLNVSHTYKKTGTYQARITVVDGRGKTAKFAIPTLKIEAVSGEYPYVSGSGYPRYGKAPLSVDLNCYAYSNITKWEWDFDGDGRYDYSSTQSCEVSHLYTRSGTYYARVRVTNSEGKKVSDSVEVNVLQEISVTRSRDTIDVRRAEKTDINVTVSGKTRVKVFLEDHRYRYVHTLQKWKEMNGTVRLHWNGMDRQGKAVAEGDYYVVVLYEDGGSVKRLDLRDQRNRSDVALTTNISAGQVFAPFLTPMEVTFTLPVAAEVSLDIGPTGSSVTERIRTLFARTPMGAGDYRILWSGDTNDGTLLDLKKYQEKYPYEARFIIFGGFYNQLADNAIFVKNPLSVTGLSTDPVIYSPKRGDEEFSKDLEIRFRLSAAAYVTLSINDAETGGTFLSWQSGRLSRGLNKLYWNGRDKDGKLLAPGVYRIGIKAVDSKGRESLTRYILQRIFY